MCYGTILKKKTLQNKGGKECGGPEVEDVGGISVRLTYRMYKHRSNPPQPAQQFPVAPYLPTPPFVTSPPTSEQEIESLEAYKAEIEEELRGVEDRLKELREPPIKKE